MGIDKTWNQELPFRQVQRLEFSAVPDLVQEPFFRHRGVAPRPDAVDGLDHTVVTDVDEGIGDGVVGTSVDGGDEGARDEERHFDYSRDIDEMEIDMRRRATELGKRIGALNAGQKAQMEKEMRGTVSGEEFCSSRCGSLNHLDKHGRRTGR